MSRITTNRLKKILKLTWAGLTRAAGLDRAWLRAGRLLHGTYGAPILLYHRVLPPDHQDVFSSPHIMVSAPDFEKQMAFLAEHYQVLPLEELAGRLARGRLPHPRLAAVTFDDGWEDNHRHAYPILKRHGLPATIFLTTGFVGEKKVFWQERLRFLLSRFEGPREAESFIARFSNEKGARLLPAGSKADPEIIMARLKGLKAEIRDALLEDLDAWWGRPVFPQAANSFLSWEQVREMSGSGISFGSHTENHRILTLAPEDEIKRELKDSRDRLEKILGKPVRMLAYPNGDFNQKTIHLAAAGGYDLAVSTIEGLARPSGTLFALERINVGGSRFSGTRGEFSADLFRAVLSGLL
ncbi:MAG: polysaccharide deacetylase family protein [Pseudomonadota bacterium]